MGTSKVLGLMLYMITMGLLFHESIAQFMPLPPPSPLRPLCASQFALVNHACIRLPYNPVDPTPPSPEEPPMEPPPVPPAPEDPDEHEHRHRHRHRVQSSPPPSSHHNHHHHHHHHQRDPTPIEQDCCRWLKEVDTECVCDLLVHLPPFLARPVHEYIVLVPNACTITYSCGGRLRPVK